MRPNEHPYRELFEGHAAGHYTLPEELTANERAYVTIYNRPYPEPPRSLFEVQVKFAEDVVAAVHDGTELPDLGAIDAARTAERQHEDACEVHQLILDTARRRFDRAVSGAALRVITDHLAPAHDETWEAFRAAYKALREYGETEHRRLLTAPAKVRKAADAVDMLTARYEAIRAARQMYINRRLLASAEDPRGKYLHMRNYHALHPSRMVMARPDWDGLDTRRYLMWMADHGGELWMPTPDQQAKAAAEESGLAQPARVPAHLRA
ncbi:hypothetical protein [Streptomyces sp. NRRL F-5630]|uniref:hypothetical protein n=1 Tax=Streptomyces sp. NRRL F-5630 TaxID=1463864 RepID=UPI003D7262F5